MTTRRVRIALGPIGFLVLLLAPVAASAVFLVWTRVTTLRLGYELARTQARLQVLEEENRVLGTTISALRSPERLHDLARDLRLRPPRAQELVQATSNRSDR